MVDALKGSESGEVTRFWHWETEPAHAGMAVSSLRPVASMQSLARQLHACSPHTLRLSFLTWEWRHCTGGGVPSGPLSAAPTSFPRVISVVISKRKALSSSTTGRLGLSSFVQLWLHDEILYLAEVMVHFPLAQHWHSSPQGNGQQWRETMRLLLEDFVSTCLPYM